mgnify:CR=1 FL=1
MLDFWEKNWRVEGGSGYEGVLGGMFLDRLNFSVMFFTKISSELHSFLS